MVGYNPVSLITTGLYFLIIIALIFIVKRLIPKEFSKIEKWRVIIAVILYAINFLFSYGTIVSALKATNYDIVQIIFIIFSIILGLIVFYLTICAIDGIITIIKSKKYAKRKNEFWKCVIALLLINPLTVQLIYSGMNWGAQAFTTYDKIPCGISFEIVDGSPAQIAGMKTDEEIIQVDNLRINSFDDFMGYMNSTRAGQSINITTDKNSYNIVLAQKPDSNIGFLGIKNLQTKYCDK